MRDVVCKLINRTIASDSIGVQNEILSEEEIPIIKIEDVYASEFYKANREGFRPSLRLKISQLNYNGQEELKYCNIIYSVIRAQEVNVDEIVLICERKTKNG